MTWPKTNAQLFPLPPPFKNTVLYFHHLLFASTTRTQIKKLKNTPLSSYTPYLEINFGCHLPRVTQCSERVHINILYAAVHRSHQNIGPSCIPMNYGRQNERENNVILLLLYIGFFSSLQRTTLSLQINNGHVFCWN